jgi:microcystin-dependent protein
MAIHPSGDGAGWTEDVDVGQPHGLDYRYTNHLAKAVRLRMRKEHIEFDDGTVGGEHKPGGIALLGWVDQSVDISMDDDTYKGRNLIWDETNSGFWCFTSTDGTVTAPNGYHLKYGPASVCTASDWTWTGAHQFDASIQIKNSSILDNSYPDGTEYETIATKGYVDDSLPVGTILPYAGAAAPTGYLLCNGQAVSRTVTYDLLFAVVSTTYGVGDGATTFNVPDLSGRAPIGAGDSSTTESPTFSVGDASGDYKYILTDGEMPSHHHNTTVVAQSGSIAPGGGWGYATRSLASNTKGNDEAHYNMSPMLTVNYIIKY